jgi:hypothetical protein
MKVGVFFIDRDGYLSGYEDRSKLESLNMVQRLWTKISKRYRKSLITLTPLPTPIRVNDINEWSTKGIKYSIETPLNESIAENDQINESFIKDKLNKSDKSKRWVIKPYNNENE